MNKKDILQLFSILLCAWSLAGCCNNERRFKISSSSMSPTFSSGEVVTATSYDPQRHSLKRFDIVAFHPPFDPNTVFLFRTAALPGETITLTTNGFSIGAVEFPEQQIPEQFRGQSWIPRSESWAVRTGQPPNLTWHLQSNEVFVVGDNLSNAYDSRYWGPLRTTNIVAIVKDP